MVFFKGWTRPDGLWNFLQGWLSQWRSKAMISPAMDMAFATAAWPLQMLQPTCLALTVLNWKWGYSALAKFKWETQRVLWCFQHILRTWYCDSAEISRTFSIFLQVWLWSSTCIGTRILVNWVATTSACTSHLAKASWLKPVADTIGVGSLTFDIFWSMISEQVEDSGSEVPWITGAVFDATMLIHRILIWSFGWLCHGFELGGANVMLLDVAICRRCCHIPSFARFGSDHAMPILIHVEFWLYHSLSNGCVAVWVRCICLDTLVHDGTWTFENHRKPSVHGTICVWKRVSPLSHLAPFFRRWA